MVRLSQHPQCNADMSSCCIPFLVSSTCCHLRQGMPLLPIVSGKQSCFVCICANSNAHRLLQQAGFLASLMLAMHSAPLPHESAPKQSHCAASEQHTPAALQQLAQLAIDGLAAGADEAAQPNGRAALDQLAELQLHETGEQSAALVSQAAG